MQLTKRLTIFTCCIIFCLNTSLGQSPVAFVDSLKIIYHVEDTSNNYQATKDGYFEIKEVCKSQQKWLEYFHAYAYYLNAIWKLGNIPALQTELDRFKSELNEIVKTNGTSGFEDAILTPSRFQLQLDLESGNPWAAEFSANSLIAQYDSLFQGQRKQEYLVTGYLDLSNAKYLEGSYQASVEANAKVLNIISEEGLQIRSDSEGVTLKPLLMNVKSYRALNQNDLAEGTLAEMRFLLGLLQTKKNERAFQVYESHFDFFLANGQQDSTQKYLNEVKKLNVEGRYETEIAFKDALTAIEFSNTNRIDKIVNHALHSIHESRGERDLLYLEILMRDGQRHLRNDRWSEALARANQGLAILGSTNSINNEVQNQSDNQTMVVELYRIKTKALFEQFNQTKNLSDLEYAWSAANECNGIIQLLRRTYTSKSDRMFLINQSYDHYEIALRIAHSFYMLEGESWVDTAFLLMEQCKALSLLDDTQLNRMLQNDDIPIEFQRKVGTLISDISALEFSILLDQRNLKSNQNGILKKQGQMRDMKVKLEMLQEEIEKKYANLTFETENIIPAFEHVINASRAEEVGFIEYFLGKESLFVLATNGRERRFILQPIEDSFISNLEMYISNIIRFGSDREVHRVQKYIGLSCELYEKLLGRIDLELPNRILIIPDGILRQLSFSTLLTKFPKSIYPTAELPFLLQNHAISFNYSYTIHSRLLANKNLGKLKVDAFAPSFPSAWQEQYPTEKGIDSLYYNIEEVKSICKSISCRKRLNENATKNSFIALSNGVEHGNTLHLSTHAVANEEIGSSSFIRFFSKTPNTTDSKLLANEISQLSLPYHLTVLSACETAAGQSVRGEGVVGLSRGFFQAGVQSLLASLWQVNDRASRDIQIQFYKELKKGISKDIALQRSQISYLENLSAGDKNVLAHPFFWAAVIPVGDMQPFEGGRFDIFDLKFVGLLIGLVLILLLFLKNRKKNKDFSISD